MGRDVLIGVYGGEGRPAFSVPALDASPVSLEPDQSAGLRAEYDDAGLLLRHLARYHLHLRFYAALAAKSSGGPEMV